MRISLSLATAIAILPSTFGFIGMGIKKYDPTCAVACSSSLGKAKLDCPEASSTMHHKRSAPAGIAPSCKAMSKPYLTTLANCMRSVCAEEVELWALEKYWTGFATGSPKAPPMWGYHESLSLINGSVTDLFNPNETMTGTKYISLKSYDMYKTSTDVYVVGEAVHARYALALFLVGVGIPILTTLLTYLPFGNRAITKLKPRFVYPALFRSYNVQPVMKWFHIPTLGQSTYICIMVILATLLSTVSYVSVQPNSHYKNIKQEMFSRIGARTGMLAMGTAPLVFLFAGRNNVLLWITNWSHGTFILLHRYVARIFGILLILHSVFELALHIDQGEYKQEAVLPYWIWGSVATIAFSIMLISSVFRGSAYEWFLISHILLAIISLVGVWYHLEYLFQGKWGYQYWLYLCFAIWGFDRLLRVGRIFKNGLNTAHVRPVGDNILRVDIEGIKWNPTPGQHAYVSFPALRKWAPWENHPFSMVPTNLLKNKTKGGWPSAGMPDTPATPYTPYTPYKEMIDSATPLNYRQHTTSPTSGITFFIKRNNGLTKRLWNMIQPITALVEGPYHSTSTRPVLLCDRLILIGGGIGITALFPFVAAHPNVKLHWSMREEQDAMIQEIQPALEYVEHNIIVNQRLNITELIQCEVANGWRDIGIVICGPGSLCDDVRRETVRIGNESGVKFELDVDAFSW